MIIVLVGPTAVGKSDISLKLAKHYNLFVLNADSVQVYKDMNIASAKLKDLEGVKHFLFDEKEIDEDYSVYSYQQDGRKILDEYKNVLICGGTGFYINALLNNYEFYRTDQYDSLSNEELIDEAKKRHLEIDLKNIRRIKSALYNDDLNSEKKGHIPLYNYITIGIKEERSTLYERINQRVDKMIEDGLIDEAKRFYPYKDFKSIQTAIGYKELFLYFEGKISLDDAIELIKKNTRNYAKRQMTYFNNKMNVKWFKRQELEKMIEYIDKQVGHGFN